MHFTGRIHVDENTCTTSRTTRLGAFTASFNNIKTLKFKIQPTVALLTAVNHHRGGLRKQKLVQWVKLRSHSHSVIGGFDVL